MTDFTGVDLISVIGGGPSAKQIDVGRLPGLVIGVNDAAVRARCDIVVSMDRLWSEYRWPELVKMQKPTHLRSSAYQNLKDKEKWLGLHIFENERIGVFSDSPGQLNGISSGFCGFNLAYQLRPRRIYLFGFDCNRKNDIPYWWPTYPWNPKGGTSGGTYTVWAKHFDAVAVQLKAVGIEVINGCLTSAITAYPRVDPQKLVL